MYFLVPGHPNKLVIVGQEPTVLAVGAGGLLVYLLPCLSGRRPDLD